MVPPPSQPVPAGTQPTRPTSTNLTTPSSLRMAASPMSYSAMTGISFTNGGGFSFENRATPRSMKWGNHPAGSYGARFYGDANEAYQIPFSTSITMESSSFAASSSAFHLPGTSMSSSYRRSYAAAARGPNPTALSSSLASMSMSYQPMAMSFGTSYNKSQVHSLMAARSDAELTKGYECCGQTHEGLHALLEHVEDHHGDGAGSGAGAAAASELNAGFSPQILAMDMELDGIDEELERETAASTRSSLSPPNMMVPNYPLPPSATKSDTSTGTSPAALHISDVLTSPPDADSNNFFASLNSARTASTCSSPPDGSLATPTTSTQPSPVFAPPKLNARGPSAFLGAASRPQPNRFDRAFNEVVAGKKDEVKVDDKIDVPTAVAPGVLFTTAVASLGIPTTPPVPGQKPSEAITENKANEGTDVSAVKPKPAEPPLPAPSLFTTHKPWRCPNPGCNKAYKQSNGLKYHQQKGQCDFAIHDAVDLGLSIEEAEERSRPFVCAVGAGCTKRYRQMNGLKYHYLNSGEHGQYGLRMLQNGTHPHPPSLPPPPKRPVHHPSTNPSSVSAGVTTSGITTSAPARPNGSAPYAIPSQANSVSAIRPGHGQPPRMGIFPTQNRPVTGVKTTPAGARPMQLPPVQRGRDAVLFSALGAELDGF